MMDGMGTFGIWAPGFGWLFMLLFLGLLILGIFALIKWRPGEPSSRDAPAQKGALQILEERYARGEIEREEFEQKKRDLGR
ncbi:MAG TPA: electron transporter RnfE [Thiobacillus sp.]|nr:electron transporter RnfE [Thiobacillus sp.]